MEINYGDPYRQYTSIRKEIDNAINDCIKRSAFIGGYYHDKFEDQLSNYLELPSALVGSGTAAQQLGLLACGVGPGDEVIVPSMTFFSTAETVNQVGATPIFCDISSNDYCINVKKIEELINYRTKAIMPVDLYGQQADYKEIKKLCDKYNLYLIQDSAQSFGSTYHEKKVGYYSDLCIHSFYPAKNLDCMGDGGAISGKPDLIDKIKKLRNHGRVEKYKHDMIGWNHRMDGLQSAILSVKIKYLDYWNSLRRENAAQYNKLLRNLPLVLPTEKQYNYHVYNQYCVLSTNRNDLLNHLLNNNIHAGIQFPLGCHQQSVYNLNISLPITEKVAKQCLSLPIYPLLTKKEIDFVSTSIEQYFIDI